MLSVSPTAKLSLGRADFGARVDSRSGLLLVAPELAAVLSNMRVHDAEDFLDLVQSLPTPLANALGWSVEDVRQAGKTLEAALRGFVPDEMFAPPPAVQPYFGAKDPALLLPARFSPELYADAITREAQTMVTRSRIDSKALADGINMVATAAAAEVIRFAQPITSRAQVEAVAAGAAGDDDYVGAVVANAFDAAGEAGSVLVQGHLSPGDFSREARVEPARTGRAAKIHVVEATHQEVAHETDRFERAVQACREALRGGIVPGGGTAIVGAVARVWRWAHDERPDKFIPSGADVLREAARAPLRAMLHRAQATPGGKWARDYLTRLTSFDDQVQPDPNLFKDLLASGVIASATGEAQTLQQAARIAGYTLTGVKASPNEIAVTAAPRPPAIAE